jgi:hypothetical protein
MECKYCKVDMKIGEAIIPVWGTFDGREIKAGDTISQVDGKLDTVMKCPDCGYSVFYGDLPFKS